METCRKCRDLFEAGKQTQRTVPASFIVWGKLFDPDDLGPRCAAHLPKSVSISRIDQYAIFDLRGISDV